MKGRSTSVASQETEQRKEGMRLNVCPVNRGLGLGRGYGDPGPDGRTFANRSLAMLVRTARKKRLRKTEKVFRRGGEGGNRISTGAGSGDNWHRSPPGRKS